MRKISNLFLLFTLVLLTACGGSSSLSKDEALQILTEELGSPRSKTHTFSTKMESVESLGSKYKLYKQYESAGLVDVKENIYKGVGRNANQRVVSARAELTSKGKNSAVGKTIVVLYKYEYDNIVDLQLVKRVVNPSDKKSYAETYLVFFTSTVSEVSDFGAFGDVKLDDTLPFPIKGEPAVYECTLDLSYADGEIVRKQLSSVGTMLKSEIAAKVEEQKEL